MGREARLKRERQQQRTEGRRAEAIDQHLRRFGLPGQAQFLVMRPVYREGDPRNALPSGGLPGAYRVVFTLARPGVLPKPETEFSFDPEIPGDSHLAILPPAVPAPPDNPNANAISVETQTEDGQLMFQGLSNDAGFLGRLVTELRANDFRDAHHKAYRAIAPMLSNWSAHLDIPINLWRTHITALETRAEQVSVVNPFLEMPFTVVAEAAMTAEFRGLVGLYREALENRSPAYQFLCLFKIAEGIRNLRQRSVDDALARRLQPPKRASWRVPTQPAEFKPWLNAIYPGRDWDDMALDGVFVPEARGRKLNDLLQKELNDLRVEVAHALSEDTGIVRLDADEALHVARVNKWLPLMKCIVRRQLKDDFPREFLSNVNEDANVDATVERNQ